MPRLKNPERAMTTVLGVRLTVEESDRVDALVKRVPIATRHRIAREALLRGLADFEDDPTLLLGPAEARPPAKARRKAKSSGRSGR